VRKVAQDSKAYVPGAVVDVVQHRGLTIGAASVRGLGHQDFGSVRQDALAFAVASNSRFIVGAIADGVSEAPNSHAGADAASKAALSSVREFLESGTPLRDIPWPEVTEAVRNNLRRRSELVFGAKLRDEAAGDATWSRQVGTTAEVLIVDSEAGPGGSFEYVRAVLAGDGYGYVISPEGLLPLGSGKAKDDGVKSNKVHPLPGDPGPGYPNIQPGRISPGEAVMITTDGIGDDMANGTTDAAGYMYAELLRPRAPHDLLAAVSYIAFQSEDDRTVLVVWALRSACETCLRIWKYSATRATRVPFTACPEVSQFRNTRVLFSSSGTKKMNPFSSGKRSRSSRPLTGSSVLMLRRGRVTGAS
jgi:hypothetical protein